jgi:hypothetical protein
LLMYIEDKNFYMDLAFYNYLLKYFVLIDLKVGKLTHHDIGQMDPDVPTPMHDPKATIQPWSCPVLTTRRRTFPACRWCHNAGPVHRCR